MGRLVMKSPEGIVLAALWLAISAAAARACDCVGPSSAAAGKSVSTLVFAGDVLSKEILALPELGPEYKEYLVKFRVQKYWKGAPPREIVLRTPLTRENCGFSFETGKAYLVYAIDAAPPLVTFCTRTVPLSEPQAEADMLQLGRWQKPPDKK